ncbi:MAG: hypothetical protein V4657_09440 [Pseudomonadota bacterium]
MKLHSLSLLSLPQKVGLAAVATLLFIGTILGGVWFIYDKGANAAEAKAEARQAKADIAHKEAVDAALNKLQTDLDKKLGNGFASVNSRLGQIDVTERTIIRPTLIKEIQNDPRLSDPDFVLPDGVRRAINAARIESACPERATGGDCGTLSRAPALE